MYLVLKICIIDKLWIGLAMHKWFMSEVYPSHWTEVPQYPDGRRYESESEQYMYVVNHLRLMDMRWLTKAIHKITREQ